MPRYKEEFIAITNENSKPDRLLLLHIEPSIEQVLRTSNAAVLLFAKNIIKFNMNCRICFIRIDGREMQVGSNYNVVKDKSIDEPILRLVDAAKTYI